MTIDTDLSRPGVLRAGINLGNILLVTGKAANGDPEGVAPSLAGRIADHLGLTVELVPFASPGEVADALADDAWDIALIAEEPERAKTIAFVDAYVEIEATYIVPEASPLKTIADVDAAGVRIAVSDRSAYDLYLSRTLQKAELVRAKGLQGALDLYVTEKLDALAGLRPALKENAADLGGQRILDGRYTAVRQAVGTKPKNAALQAAIAAYLKTAKADGTIAGLLETFGVQEKLSVAGD
ncbi:transporter substrate-binding domain-containing protein [Thalassobaculum salexigens]|uniref:transporter substrate-binding domain-containing protein n=1 Tax=Thalassobaculum salexigens TaxID=455360 RepID=UPI000424EEAE|nr:transporter substrate-binding domain-containing protein [Thalassobaculum salexigens]